LTPEEEMLARCDVCGNEYDKSFEIRLNGSRHVFDCFECAIHALAPECARCGCRIVGHGSEVHGTMYCSAHCAAQEGARQLRDRA
jgi:hypothetical protein